MQVKTTEGGFFPVKSMGSAETSHLVMVCTNDSLEANPSSGFALFAFFVCVAYQYRELFPLLLLSPCSALPFQRSKGFWRQNSML